MFKPLYLIASAVAAVPIVGVSQIAPSQNQVVPTQVQVVATPETNQSMPAAPELFVAKPYRVVMAAAGCKYRPTACNHANLRIQPIHTSEVLAAIPEGSIVNVTGEASGEYRPVKVGEVAGFIYTTYLQPVQEPQKNAKP
jgi:hypothetical protein